MCTELSQIRNSVLNAYTPASYEERYRKFMLKRFLRYYKPHKLLFSMDILCAVLYAAIAVIYPVITRAMLNDLIPNRLYRSILFAGAGLLLLYVVRTGLRYFMIYWGHIVGVRIQAQMRMDMFRHLQRLPFRFYDEHETGRIMSGITTDLFDIAELAHHGPENIITSAVSLLAAFIYLSSINITLTLIIFLCVPVLMFFTMKLRTRIQRVYRRCKETLAGINASIQNSISGVRVTKAFTNSAQEEKKFEVCNGQFASASAERYRAMALFHSVTSFVTDLFNAVVLLAGGIFLFNGKINYADYSAFILSVNLFINPITTLLNFMEQFQEGATGFERFLEVMDTPEEEDSPEACATGRLQGKIEFRNVTYGYENGETRDEDGENRDGNENESGNRTTEKHAAGSKEAPGASGSAAVLKNISFTVKPGETYALVGTSGGGKTTVCHLIPHFYDVKQGQILLDGREIHTITADSLRRNIGIVQQDNYIFNMSVRENILYGNPEATEKEIVEAAKMANIHDYIQALPDGYDTVVGERGVKLSGGQKQRLCIARVFLKNPPILILDEATSALDNATESQIQQALDKLCRGRTTIVVAHRLSTIKNADEIAVIEDGHIVEQGSHEQLLKRSGAYAALWNMTV